MKERSKTLIASVAVVVVFVCLIAWALSPSISPFPIVHDADRDGHPDANDPAPYDPLIWAVGSVSCSVKLNSNHTNSDVQYTVYANDMERANGTLGPRGSITIPLIIYFPYGLKQNTSITLELSWFDIVNGHHYVVIPDDREGDGSRLSWEMTI